MHWNVSSPTYNPLLWLQDHQPVLLPHFPSRWDPHFLESTNVGERVRHLSLVDHVHGQPEATKSKYSQPQCIVIQKHYELQFSNSCQSRLDWNNKINSYAKLNWTENKHPSKLKKLMISTPNHQAKWK
jgi:hypothetical protein